MYVNVFIHVYVHTHRNGSVWVYVHTHHTPLPVYGNQNCMHYYIFSKNNIMIVFLCYYKTDVEKTKNAKPVSNPVSTLNGC